MENTFALYMDIPEDFTFRIRRKVEASARECLAVGYRTAGWASLEAALAAVASNGVALADAGFYILERVQDAVYDCLKEEGGRLQLDLVDQLTPRLEQISGGWTDWQ
ncbi:hypothetical protein [Azospirillum endophyticum]